MKKNFFEDWSDEIRSYFDSNGLDFDKARKMPKSYGKSDIWVLYGDPEKGKDGLRDETPMPIVLMIDRKPDGTLVFEQTEHTRKYLT